MDKKLESLEEQCQELEKVIDLCIDYVTIANKDGIFTRVIGNLENLEGLKQKDIVGKSCFEFEDSGILNKSITAEVIRRKKKICFVQTVKFDRKTLVTGYPIFTKDKELVKVINISTDITNEVDLERELKDTEAKLEWFKKERRSKLYEEQNYLATENRNMKEIKNLTNNLANKDILILILGDTGVGKSYLARYIHNISYRNNEPFISINCGAIPHNLLESELFGYEKGSFTGASETGKLGLLEIANGGTVFLDEIGELPLNLQAKLLEVLDEKKFRRVGGNYDIDLKARVLVATNKNLSKAVNDGSFRKDLYYRINIFPINIPPLKRRLEDIPELINIFLKKYNKKYDISKQIGAKGYEELLRYEYPGNIRELKNIIERLVIMSKDSLITERDVRKVIGVDDLEKSRRQDRTEEVEIVPLKKGVEEYEKKLLKSVINKYKTTREQAKALDINQSTIVRKRKKYCL